MLSVEIKTAAALRADPSRCLWADTTTASGTTNGTGGRGGVNTPTTKPAGFESKLDTESTSAPALWHLRDPETDSESDMSESDHCTKSLPFGSATCQFLQQLEAFMLSSCGGREHLPGVLTDGRTWYLARFRPAASHGESRLGTLPVKHLVEWTRLDINPESHSDCSRLVHALIAMIVTKARLAEFLGKDEPEGLGGRERD